MNYDNLFRIPAILICFFLTLYVAFPAHAADETICARVRIQIDQELTLERQAFDAHMRINNGLSTIALEDVGVDVLFSDEEGNSVLASSDPDNTDALFFIRLDSMVNINNVSGSGTVAPSTTADIHWLIIPAQGAGGELSTGKLYYVGATLRYTLKGEEHVTEVTPDYIFVKPLPLLTLDYFLTRDVYADDAFTPAVEPSEPFTLGVRVKNNGKGVAHNIKIDSAQPRIIENKQGLLISYQIINSTVNDEPAIPSLLVNLRNIEPKQCTVARWQMITTLSGQFVEFEADFSHADELGGELTSLLEETNAHSLVHDVLVDLPGRDSVCDFLAKDGDVLRVYESSGVDSGVTDQSANATLQFTGQIDSVVDYMLNAPPTIGFLYIKLPDPYNGTKEVTRIMRSDGKLLSLDNVWLSKTRREDNSWDFFINVFDVNSTGQYTLKLVDRPIDPLSDYDRDSMPDVWEQKHFGTLDRNGTGDFDGDGISDLNEYLNGTDPTLNNAPTIPEIFSPEDKAEVTTLQPALVIQNSTDPEGNEITYIFELYADETITTLVASQLNVPEGPQTTSWAAFDALDDNTWYYWRVRATDGSGFSKWAYGSFFVNTENDPPGSFATSSPQDGTEVDTLRPTLEVTNSVDIDHDQLTYTFKVYTDSNMNTWVASALNIEAGEQGTTRWGIDADLDDNTSYFWQVIATDEHGAQIETPLASFLVNASNHAPFMTGIVSPLNGSEVVTQELDLVVTNASDEDADGLTYVFEFDRVDTFDSPAKRTSEEVPEGTETTSWHVSDLVDNSFYYWRAKASDGAAESDWVYGSFFVNTANDNPATPTVRNPGPMAWVDTPTPTLEVNRAPDVDHDSVSYEFELYVDSSLRVLVVQDTSDIGAWVVPLPLTDRNWYYWRARAKDEHGAVSAWTEPASFFVKDNGINDPPHITLVEPSIDMETTGDPVVITWEDMDPDSNATIALYYDTDGFGADGTLIVDGLAEDPDGQNDAYVWDISGMPCGTYHVYATILDETSSYTAYAQGSITIAKEVILDLPSGWSMVSLPINPTDKRLKAVFPNAVVVYRYEKGAGYIRVKADETLTVGKGYWVLLDQTTSYTITGQPIQSYTHTTDEDGWAMIGGCTDPAQVLPNGCDIVVIYGYTQGTGYQRVTGHLEPGKGYWILLTNVAEGGMITVETDD